MARTPHAALVNQFAKTIGSPRAAELHFGVIKAVDTGNGTVTVALNGATTQVPGVRRLATYTPTVNDTVVVAKVGTDNRLRQDWLVIGALAT